MSRNPSLALYLKLLLKWQDKINLISPKTIQTAWERHFEDSLQILDYLPDGALTLFDIGSGAGFPGLVLAIERPNHDVHLIESDQKKCVFLKTVSRETDIPVTIHNGRIENIAQETDTYPDIVTARALASLDQLLALTEPWWRDNGAMQAIFLKGERAEEEIAEARKKYDFTLQQFTSQTDKAAQVLVLKEISLCA